MKTNKEHTRSVTLWAWPFDTHDWNRIQTDKTIPARCKRRWGQMKCFWATNVKIQRHLDTGHNSVIWLIKKFYWMGTAIISGGMLVSPLSLSPSTSLFTYRPPHPLPPASLSFPNPLLPPHPLYLLFTRINWTVPSSDVNSRNAVNINTICMGERPHTVPASQIVFVEKKSSD